MIFTFFVVPSETHDVVPVFHTPCNNLEGFNIKEIPYIRLNTFEDKVYHLVDNKYASFGK